VSGNVHYSQATQRTQALLLQGQSLANALQQHGDLFQPMLIQMCAIGEASGTLDAMLERCADEHDAQVNRLVSQLSVLIEPLLMLLLGMLIGGMVLALYLPLFQMGQVI
jgi:type IV pilus assembly protein PilC